ncbi:MAG: hypothetical protein ACREX0_04745 [Noviherbaspirillum sp.]
MGILGSILGRREPVAEYRTVDGGHPAPYPDMTDEQLYNYETTFDVPHKTFDKPPRPAAAAGEERTVKREPTMRSETSLRDKVFDAPRYTARAAETPTVTREPAPREHIIPSDKPVPLDLTKPVRTVTTRQPVEIITTRARHPVYKVHGYIGDDDVVTVFTLDGQISENGPRFLENAPPTQCLHLNIYRNPDPHSKERYLVTQHGTREEADCAATVGRLTCARVEFDM